MSRKHSEVDSFVWPRLRQLRSLYRKSCSVEVICDQGSRLLKTAKSLSGFQSSYQAASLESFIGEVLLAGGATASSVRLAKAYADSALQRLDVASRIAGEVLELTVHTSLIAAVASKALGDQDEMFRSLEAARSHTSRVFSATIVDQIPLLRQEAIMRQQADTFLSLAQTAGTYAAVRPCEYYSTLKRYFEYLLNHRKLALAKQVEPELRRAYRNAVARLPVVSTVSFLKNFGHYFLLQGEQRLGRAVLTNAFMAAAQLGLNGQRRQLVALLQAHPGHERLESFAVR